MPVSFRTATLQRAKIEVPVGAETLNITFNASALTPAFFAALPDVLEGDNRGQIESLLTQLQQLIVEWDLLDGEGKDAKPMPVTTETLSQLDVRLLTQIMTKINEVTRPNEAGTLN